MTEARFLEFAASLPDVIFVSDARSRRVLYVSPAYEQIWGRPREVIFSDDHHWIDCVHPDDRALLRRVDPFDNLPPGSHDTEYRIHLPDGSVRWVWSRWVPLRDAQGRPDRIAGITRDISERKRLESALQRSVEDLESRVRERTRELAEAHALQESTQRFLRHTVDSLTTRLAILDETGRILTTNRAWSEAGESSIDRLLFCPQGLDYLAVCDRMASAGASELRRVPEAIRAVLAGDHPMVEDSWTLPGVDGARWFVSRVTRFTDGPEVRIVVAIEEITELRNAREELRRREALASLGRLAAGIAHEINNPLASILATAELGIASAGSGETDPLEILRSIGRQARRGGRIVQSVLQFARDEPAEKNPLDLALVVQRAIEAIREDPRRASARIDLDLRQDLPTVLGNATALEQVFVNLLRNAVEAGDLHTRVRVELREIRRGWLRATVRDDGPGMPESQISSIFDPFFTTRRSEGGSGLGLSIVHGIVTDHGGTVSVSSQPGRGATFFIDLPADPLPADPPPEHPSSRTDRGSEYLDHRRSDQ